MAEQFPQSPIDSSTPPSQTGFEERERRHSNSAPWIGGAILIVLGIFFLLRNVGFVSLNNWWALFILIPAIGSFGTAWSIYRNNGGRLTNAVRGPIIGGLILTMVALAFLLSLNWGVIWPAFLIIIGLGALITALNPD